MTISKSLNLKSFLLATTILVSPLAPFAAMAQVSISIQLEPPALPVYEQPPIPETGYIWTPGYWAYDNDAGYFWVPGTWVQPPEVNVLWTPPYWGWSDGNYVFHDGYWGEHVGYYGGVDYGYGYGGSGYEGGRWEGGNFAYNGTVNNFGDRHLTNVYRSNVTVINHSQVSFAGGPHGLASLPTAADHVAEREHHLPVTSIQTTHFSAAAKNPALAAKTNAGHPAIAATARPGQFSGPGIVPARAPGPEHAPEHNTVAQPTNHEAPVQNAAPAHETAVLHPVEHAPPAHEAPVQHGTPTHEMPTPGPVEHTTPVRATPVERVPPAHEAPVEHAAPAHETVAPHPVDHMAPARAAPVEHAAPAHEAPVEHAVAPAPHAAPVPAAAPPHAAPPQSAAPHPAAAPPKKEEEEKKP